MSSRRHERRNACLGKVRHDSKATALAHLHNLKASDALSVGETKRTRADGWMNAYLCRFCSGWHVGHMPKRVARSIAARRASR